MGTNLHDFASFDCSSVRLTSAQDERMRLSELCNRSDAKQPIHEGGYRAFHSRDFSRRGTQLSSLRQPYPRRKLRHALNTGPQAKQRAGVLTVRLLHVSSRSGHIQIPVV